MGRFLCLAPLGLLLAGCHFFARPLAGQAVPPAVTVSGASIPDTVTGPRLGRLVLLIKWPDRDYRTFKAAAIPTSTNAIAIAVKDASGKVLAEKLIQREAGKAQVSAAIDLEAGTNLSVLARCYRESNPDLATATPIAEATAAGVTIHPAADNKLSLKLAPLFAPAIEAMSLAGGAVGDTLRLTGKNFGLVAGATPSVTFFGLTSSVSAQVTPVDDKTLDVKVPDGAAAGRVVVKNDGIESESNAVFWVATALAIDAPKSAWDDKPADVRVILPEATVSIQPRPTWVLPQGATDSAAPYPAWQLSEASAGQISPAGEFKAGTSIKNADLTAKLGTLTSNTLKLSVQDVTVSITPATGSLGPAGAAWVKFTAINTFSDGATNSRVSYTSSEGDSVAINSSGNATPASKAGTSFGIVSIRAALWGDARRFATSLVTLTNFDAQTLIGRLFADGESNAARFDTPVGIAFDAQGYLYCADSRNNRIRKIAPDGTVSTLAGSGQAGYQDGPSNTAMFNRPAGVAVAKDGSLVVSETIGLRIRRITTDGLVGTIAGTGQQGGSDGPGMSATFRTPGNVVLDSSGNIYVSETLADRLRRISPAGTVTTVVGNFSRPSGLAIDPNGNLFISSLSGNVVQKLAPDGKVSTFAGSGNGGLADGVGADASFKNPLGLATDSRGNVYCADRNNGRIRKISPDGLVTTVSGAGGEFVHPSRVAVHPDGTLYVTEALGTYSILRVALDGSVTTFAGSSAKGFLDGQLATARLNSPRGIAIDAAGTMYIADTRNYRIRKVTPGGEVGTLAGSGTAGFADGPGSDARFLEPQGVAVDSGGNAFVADTDNHRIRKIAAGTGTVTTLAGETAGYAEGVGTAARFNSPRALAVDGQGIVYVADTGNRCIRKIALDATVTTLAREEFSQPEGISVDVSGYLFVADAGNNKIWKVSPAGVVAQVAGQGAGFADGASSTALFSQPRGIAVDKTGIIYVADASNARVRRISVDGHVSSLAGTSSRGFADGIGTAALFDSPVSVAVDPSGNVIVVDNGNAAIRKLTIVP